MEQNYNLIIIGAGIVGNSILFHLLEDGFKGKIGIYDRLDDIASDATAKSAGAFRNLWSTSINTRLTTYSINKFKSFEKDMGFPIGFHQCGYLFTYYEKDWGNIVKFKPKWDEVGVRVKLLSPEEIEKFVPGIRIKVDDIEPEIREFIGFEDIAGGLFGEDCGVFDPTAVAKGYFLRAKELYPKQFELHLEKEVKRLLVDDRVKGIELKSGERIGSDMVILATGSYTQDLLKESGIEENVPVVPVKQMLFVTNLPDLPGYDRIPFTIVDKGIYFKFEAGNLLMGRVKLDREPGYDTTPEISYYKDEINSYLQERIPAMRYCNVKNMWAGLYDVNHLDHNAILGPHTSIKGLYLAVGFSGHGAMESEAVGKCISELINFGEYRTIDASPLSMERFKNNQLIKETIVI